MVVALLVACVEEIATPNLREPQMVVNCLLTSWATPHTRKFPKLSLPCLNTIAKWACSARWRMANGSWCSNP